MLNRIQKMTPASERYLGNLWTAFGSVKRIDAVNGWVAERRTTTDDHGDSVRAELEPTEAGHMTSFRSVEAEKVEKRVSRVVWCLSHRYRQGRDAQLRPFVRLTCIPQKIGKERDWS